MAPMTTVDTQLLKGILTMVLLQMLRDEEDYGYAVVLRLEQAGFGALTEGTVYPALTRLESKGWLTSRLIASSSGPARKYYRTTRAGAAELRRAREGWANVVDAVANVLSPADPVAPPSKAAPSRNDR
jgi:PadR family transcriptional regulator PadR